jgi:hypothetical protein
MSAPSTPTPASDVAAITPGDTAKDGTAPLVHFSFALSEIIDIFVDILDEEMAIHNKLKEGLSFLLEKHWRITKWRDLKLFSSEDVKLALVSGNGMPAEMLTPVIIKKISCVIDYSKHGVLTTGLTLDEVPSPTRKGSFGASDAKYDKKNLPTLEKFSGLAEEARDLDSHGSSLAMEKERVDLVLRLILLR